MVPEDRADEVDLEVDIDISNGVNSTTDSDTMIMMNNMVKVKIGTTSVCALLDTGSMVNLISSSLLQKVAPKAGPIGDLPSGKSYFGANLEPL